MMRQQLRLRHRAVRACMRRPSLHYAPGRKPLRLSSDKCGAGATLEGGQCAALNPCLLSQHLWYYVRLNYHDASSFPIDGVDGICIAHFGLFHPVYNLS